jgi:hypothetical protein
MSVPPLSPPKPISPGSGSYPGQTINTLTPEFRWETSHADYYTLFISEYPYGPNHIIYTNEHIEGTSFILPASNKLEYGKKYRWNMQSHYSTGARWSGLSYKLYFQTPPAPVQASALAQVAASTDPLDQQAQWRVASSYGLGQLLYVYQGDKIGWEAPETFYDPSINIRSAVQYLVELRGQGCAGDFSDLPLNMSKLGLSRAVLGYNWGGLLPCSYSSLGALKKASRSDLWDGNVPKYLLSVWKYLPQTQPIAVLNADTSGILSPPSSLNAVASLASSMFPAPGEYEVDRLVADLKGTAQPQLAVLYVVVNDPQVGPAEGVLKVFTDAAGSALEWQSPPMPGVLPVGTVYTQTLSVGGPPILAASWGVGAHGTVLFLFRWYGQTFSAVPVIEAGGEEFYSLFGDAGVLVTGTGLVVDDRDANEPLNVTIVTTYDWNEETEAFSYEDQQVIRNIPYQLYLPLILRNYP